MVTTRIPTRRRAFGMFRWTKVRRGRGWLLWRLRLERGKEGFSVLATNRSQRHKRGTKKWLPPSRCVSVLAQFSGGVSGSLGRNSKGVRTWDMGVVTARLRHPSPISVPTWLDMTCGKVAEVWRKEASSIPKGQNIFALSRSSR